MPVGKNALKRVTNNGYSKVAASAPDMENSEVVTTAEPKAQTKEISVKTAPNKNTTPKTKRTAAPKPEMKKAEEINRPDGFVRCEFGQDLPIYLL